MLNMPRIGNDPNRISDLPSLPESVLTMDGQWVDTSTLQWKASTSADGGGIITLNWALLDDPKRIPLFTPRAWHLVKLYFADRLTKRKMGTVASDYTAFLAFERWLVTCVDAHLLPSEHSCFNWSAYTEGLARGFLAHGVRETASKGKNFSAIRAFYRWGVARQHSDFTASTLAILQSIRAIGNVSGYHVRFRDSLHGPFSPDERWLLGKAIEEERGRDRDRAIVSLHFELGLNPNATVRLKNKDLKKYDVNDMIVYHLHIPRVKKRTTRRETKRRPISTRLGKLLEQLMQGDSEEALFHWIPEGGPNTIITQAMRRFAKAACLVSPLTHEPLHLNPRRFRYTLATHLAEEGASKLHIAEILDHTNTQHVDVYVETVSSIADSVAQATNIALVPLVKRFLGKLIDTSSEEVCLHQEIPSAVPHLPVGTLNMGGIGFCGRNMLKDGLCMLFPPLSCYLCPFFAALRTQAHHEVFTSLKAFIEQWQGKLDPRILLQLNDILLAIKEVLQQLETAGSSAHETEERIP